MAARVRYASLCSIAAACNGWAESCVEASSAARVTSFIAGCGNGSSETDNQLMSQSSRTARPATRAVTRSASAAEAVETVEAIAKEKLMLTRSRRIEQLEATRLPFWCAGSLEETPGASEDCPPYFGPIMMIVNEPGIVAPPRPPAGGVAP